MMLPGIDGLTIAKSVRAKNNTPIIMLTSKNEEIDKIVGLEIGADDYIAKSFSPKEMMARIKAVLRRSCKSSQSILRSLLPLPICCPKTASEPHEVLLCQ